MDDELERLLQPDYLDGLAQRPIEEVRALRAECVDVETGLSYLRRMVQGPLDLVRYEVSQRAGGHRSDLASLLAELPEVLSDGPRSAGAGRVPLTLEPTRLVPSFAAEVDALGDDSRLLRLSEVSDDDLVDLGERLAGVERRISDQRRLLHGLIDQLQAELTRRYADGEATVDSLLSSD